MPKLPKQMSTDERLNELKEGYKKDPEKYKEKLAGVIYCS